MSNTVFLDRAAFENLYRQYIQYFHVAIIAEKETIRKKLEERTVGFFFWKRRLTKEEIESIIKTRWANHSYNGDFSYANIVSFLDDLYEVGGKVERYKRISDFVAGDYRFEFTSSQLKLIILTIERGCDIVEKTCRNKGN
jgi:hypothetical protein